MHVPNTDVKVAVQQTGFSGGPAHRWNVLQELSRERNIFLECKLGSVRLFVYKFGLSRVRCRSIHE